MKRTVVKKDDYRTREDHTGYLKAVCIVEDDSTFKISEFEDFPNRGQIFVNTRYDLIDEQFDENELFFLNEYTESIKFNADHHASAKFTTAGYKVDKPDKHQLCIIFEKDFDPNKPYRLINSFIPKSYVFINPPLTNILYGPFNAEVHEISDDEFYNLELKPVSYSELNLKHDFDKFIYKFKIEDISNSILSTDGNRYVYNAINLINTLSTEIDPIYYGNNEDLLEWGKKIIGQTSNIEDRILKDLIRHISITPPDIAKASDAAKLDKLKKILTGTETWLVSGLPKFIYDYLNTEEKGKAYFDAFLEQNKNDLLKRYDQEIKVKENDIYEINELLKIKKLEIAEITQEPRYKNISTETQKIISDIIEAEEKHGPINDLLEKYQLIDQIEVIRYALSVKQKELDGKEKKLKELSDEILLTENDLNKFRDGFRNSEDVKKKLLDLKPYVDILNGVIPSNNKEGDNSNHYFKYPKINNDLYASLDTFVYEVQSKLRRLGREIEYNDLINYILCIQQNFLTVFAGLPGVGKTSLTTKLIESLGFKERFLSVSVSRGWTSTKDFIGYFNPLTNSFQASKTNFYKQVAKRYDKELKENIDVPFYVLLDEANLSPIEHYWSDFMKLTDPESEKIISLGEQNKTLKLGEGLRFIATINYDHTTEILSPRLIDRAPIILLNPISGLIENFEIEKVPQIEEYISTQQFLSLFSNNKLEFEDDEKALFKKIKESLENDDTSNFGMPIIVSPRKQKSTMNYCSAARGILQEANQFTALDFAVTQNILPLISGRGEKFGKRLDNLLKVVERHLPKTGLMLKNIINSGSSNYHNYRFFH